MADEAGTTPKQDLPSNTPSDPPSPPSSSAGDHPSEPPTVEGLAAELQELRGDKARLHQLELENATLQGRLQGSGGQQQAPFAFNTPEEYQLALQNYQLQGQQVEQDSQEFAQLKQNDAYVRQDYNRFVQKRQTDEQAGRQREIARAAFLAARQIDPESDTARYIEVLHEADVPFERIEQQVIAPAQELARLRGQDASQQRQTTQMQNATSIEPGTQHTGLPAPVGQRTLTPDQSASADLERRMENRAPDLEQALFGEQEFLE